MNFNPSGGTGTRRRAAIAQLLAERAVRSQGELRRLLRQRGFAVAQPTLSRDVRELGLAKTPRGYVAPADPAPRFAPAPGREATLGRALRGFALSVQAAGTLVIVKTPPAAAHPVARALDEAPLPAVVGTIAGDDTVFIATPSEQAARALARRLGGTLRKSTAEAGA
jgi:transcriptional regulator of arginine metabolism